MSVATNGTSQGFDVPLSSIITTPAATLQLSLWFRYAAAFNPRTICFAYNSGDLNDYVRLYKDGNTLKFKVADITGVNSSSAELTTTISVNTWHHVEAYHAAGNIGLKLDSASWQTTTLSTPSQYPSVDSASLGFDYTGGGGTRANWFSGQLADVWLHQATSYLEAASYPDDAQMADMRAKGLAAFVLVPRVKGLAADGSAGGYWPMRDVNLVRNTFSGGASLTAVGSPTQGASHPKVFYPDQSMIVPQRTLRSVRVNKNVYMSGSVYIN